MADVMHENNAPLNKAPSQESQQEQTVTTPKAAAVSHADHSQHGHGARRSEHHHQSRLRRHQPQSAFRGGVMSMRHATPITPTIALPYGHHFYYYPRPPGTPPSAGGPMSYGGCQTGWWWYGNENGFIMLLLQQLPLHPPMMYQQNPISRRQPGQNGNFHGIHAYSSWPSQQQMNVPMHYYLAQGTPGIAQLGQPTTSSTAVGQGGGLSWRHNRTQSRTDAYPETRLRPWAPEFVPINSLHSVNLAQTS